MRENLVFDLKRILSGSLILLIVFSSYSLNLDKLFLLGISIFIFYDLYFSKIINLKNKFLDIIFLISIILFVYFYNNKYLIFYLFLTLVFFSYFESKFRNILFICILLLYLCTLFFLNINNRELFYLIFLISFINDTSAYIFGKLLKGPLIIPKISPKKTWSGTILSFIISFLILIYLNFTYFYSFITAVSFFLGDIYFSFIKRKFNLKDFSNIIIGHGGVLDRLDSIFLPSLIVYIFIL